LDLITAKSWEKAVAAYLEWLGQKIDYEKYDRV
jgi:hypothetical protein